MAKEVLAKNLQVGDVVKCLKFEEFSTAIVRGIDHETNSVVLFRPYATTAGFTYTGGTIPLIGIEEFKIPRNDTLYTVYRNLLPSDGV